MKKILVVSILISMVGFGFGVIVGLSIITTPTPQNEIEIIGYDHALPDETFAEYMIRQKIKKRAINEYRKEVLDKKD